MKGSGHCDGRVGPEERSTDRAGVQSLRRKGKLPLQSGWHPSYSSLPKANTGPSVRHFETAASRTETHGV